MIFYFDLYDGKWSHKDEFGDDLQTMQEAMDMATALVTDLVCEIKTASTDRVFVCEVRDSDGIVVHRSEVMFKLTTVAAQT